MSFFTEGAYEVLEFYMPSQGMNQNISPHVLPSNFAYILDNIIPDPQGRGMVRYGTDLLDNSLPVDSDIIKSFPFFKSDGNQQFLLYVSQFKQDNTITDVLIIDESTISFSSIFPEKYIQDVKVKIIYSIGGVGTYFLYDYIGIIVVENNHVIFTFNSNQFPADTNNIQILSIHYSDGNIYSYDVASKTMSDSLFNGLSVATIPRYTSFQNTLLICNGVDKIMSWDGEDLSIITDYVKEIAVAFNRIDATHFSFQIPDNFIISKYQNNNTIKLSVNGTVTTLVVSNVGVNVNIAVITTFSNIPNFTGQDEVILSYADYPPPFSFLFVGHSRIWGLAQGAVGLQYRVPTESMKVYYTNQKDSITAWFDERTKKVRNIDLSDKHGVSDNLEAICQINNYITFIGRIKTQVWQGTDPTANASASNAFSWAYNLEIGIPHGDLIVELPNDTWVVTSNGIISFSTYNIARQLAATSSNAIDPLVRDYVNTLTQSNINYRACRSFKYKSGPFCGFKIGRNPVLASLYDTSLYSWFYLSGDFFRAQDFCAQLNDTLYLMIDNKIYRYGDGNFGVFSYGDQGGKALISYSCNPAVFS